MIGWTLGTVEAILISILVRASGACGVGCGELTVGDVQAGFSVDYVVHLAHAYATVRPPPTCPRSPLLSARAERARVPSGVRRGTRAPAFCFR
eukprot:3940512-Rhodomonas_salina.4